MLLMTNYSQKQNLVNVVGKYVSGGTRGLVAYDIRKAKSMKQTLHMLMAIRAHVAQQNILQSLRSLSVTLRPQKTRKLVTLTESSPLLLQAHMFQKL